MLPLFILALLNNNVVFCTLLLVKYVISFTIIKVLAARSGDGGDSLEISAKEERRLSSPHPCGNASVTNIVLARDNRMACEARRLGGPAPVGCASAIGA